MNEGKQMYADLMNLLLPLLPSNIFHDVRRVQTLAWALVGLCMTQTVRLSAWAEVVDSRAQLASSRVRRFARWLHQGAISPQQWYEPLLLQALRDWRLPKRVYVALDATALHPFVLIRASLIYEGRAIPLPDVRFHDLRHGVATVLLAAKVDLKVVSELLGYSSVAITADIYAHVLPEMQQEVVKRMDDLYGGS